MKRGLVVRDPAEIPDDEWRERLAAVRRAMTAEGVDVALVYGDVSRSDDIAYLTNLCIYWNEGILAVPASGEPVFLTKLSPRVHPWMRRVSTVTDLRSGRNLGELVAELVGRDGGTVGLVDAPLWPVALVEDLTAALRDRPVKRLGSIVRDRRLTPSVHEAVLLRRAAGLVVDALGEATRGGLTPAARTAAIERRLRGAGFLDVATRVGETTDGVTSVEVTGQYRTLWLRCGRLAGGDGIGWPDVLRQAIRAAVAAAHPGATTGDLAAAAAPVLTQLPAGAATEVRCIPLADLATGGEYTPQPASAALRAGFAVTIGVEAWLPDGGHVTAADTVLVGADGAECLTGP